jgi:hypothetical protein
MAEPRGLNAISICLAAGLLTETLSSTAQSAECFPGPDFQPPAGTRWQYQRDSATNNGCWYVQGLNVRGDSRTATRSSRSGVASAASQKTTKMAPPRAERRDMTPAMTGWFSPNSWGRADLPDAYSERDQDELRRPVLTPERSQSSRAISKAIRDTKERPNKIAQPKPGREQHASAGAQDRYSISAVARLEAAGDKPVPGLLPVPASDLKKAIEAVGDKDVVPSAAGPKDDWQQVLYEEFLRWRLRQVLHEKARTIRRELDTSER